MTSDNFVNENNNNPNKYYVEHTAEYISYNGINETLFTRRRFGIRHFIKLALSLLCRGTSIPYVVLDKQPDIAPIPAQFQTKM